MGEMEEKTTKKQKNYNIFYNWPPLKIHLNSWAFTLFMLAAATAISALFFNSLENANANIALTYALAVFLTARFTDNYRYGLFATAASVVAVNYLYTFPYWRLNFMMTGYPLTFLAMFTISGITSAITTNMKEQAHALHEQEKALMEADKEKMRANLLRAISHDLRTPLTSIIGAGQVYLENGQDMTEEKKRELVSHILEDSNWLLNMVENILSVTRINNQTAKVNTTSEPVEEVLGDAVSRLKKRLPEAKIHVRIPDEVVMIPMDAVLIEQVLINLMENAVLHSGSVRPVDCYAEVKPREVIFHVRDYGQGIPKEKLETIFDGQSTEPIRTESGHKGMGIGLSICKTIVAAHGGTIWAVNRNPGAEFCFSLPGDEEKESGVK